MDIMSITDEGLVQMWIDHAKKTNEADSCYNVGLFFLFGQGIDADVEEARSWFEKAAVQGHMESMTNLGTLYGQNGDLVSAEKWFRQAAELGDEKAERNLAVCLQQMDKGL